MLHCGTVAHPNSSAKHREDCKALHTKKRTKCALCNHHRPCWIQGVLREEQEPVAWCSLALPVLPRLQLLQPQLLPLGEVNHLTTALASLTRAVSFAGSSPSCFVPACSLPRCARKCSWASLPPKSCVEKVAQKRLVYAPSLFSM